jgi:hypothetical protein
MTMHDSRDPLLEAMIGARKLPVAPEKEKEEKEECSKCGRSPTDYSDFRGWDLNLATDQAFCGDCTTGP